jgi:ABC-2 type transport system ATP-binding protein
MSGTALEVRGLAHAYKQRRVLTGVDLDVRRGEVFGLLGPNGSGKSTALAILAGLIARQAGTIRWDGREVHATDRRFRADLGVVFQRASVDPKVTARQNLLMAASLQGLPGAVARTRADELLRVAGLDERAGDDVSEFSGGMRRRLDLARALVHDPRLLLMDEPTSGLDEASFRETWRRLETLREGRELTILVATHRPEEAERCDRLAVMHEGRIVTVATPTELQALVANDVIALECADPERLRTELKARFGLESLLHRGQVLVDAERGHELIPRLVEGLRDVRLDAVSLRRPTLADAFLKVTGSGLADAEEGVA